VPPRPDGEGRLIQAVYYIYVGASAVVRWLPESLTYRLAHAIGTLAARRSKKRAQVAHNLSRIVGKSVDHPDVQELVVDAYRSYTRYWLETFRLVREDAAFFLDRFIAPTQENLFAPARTGQGAIVVVGHLGNFDAAGAWVAANGFKLVTVAEVLKPRRMFDFFVAHRARLGMTIYPAVTGVTAKMVEEVRGGAVVAVLGDRDLKGTGPDVTFFGEPATFPGGAASMAIETGAALVVAGVYGVIRDGKPGWDATITEPLDTTAPAGVEPGSRDHVAAVTRDIARELEVAIARRPEEWHVFQPFWTADRKSA